ncbi:pirin family protein [Chromatiaceae bacterium AAb-1]|nr:pirin family protein [Chromatiaceae bacterium AAb-1]
MMSGTEKIRKAIKTTGSYHWVGDGFPVRSLFSYHQDAELLSPFLLLDYAGPVVFPATEQRRGVGAHPHRGFETVTIVYDGEVEHRDSTGGGGVIGPGDVQWMTAGAGIVHEEFHGSDWAKGGGAFEMVQLWVNLPAKDKMHPAGYQSITAAEIPQLALPDNRGTVRVIAGSFGGNKGPARTFSPINVWDLRLNEGQHQLAVPEQHMAILVVLKGEVTLTDGKKLTPAEAAVYDTSGNEIRLHSTADAMVLLLTGVPLNEPVVGHGPFVMNTEQEIHQAFTDYQRGTFS